MELSVKGICKSFGAGNVLDGVDFTVRGGEICALLGENGAGKSTLMNIISGVISADSGEIMLDGKKVAFRSPAESQRAGIAFIHQELNIVNDLTVYENMFLPDFPKKGLFIDKELMISKTKQIFDRLGIDIDPRTPAGELDASYKQMVEIAKALLASASVIIMDEPTSSLTSAETQRVFGVMKSLRENGIAMIFISHKLNEVMYICDRFTVLRNGVSVKSGMIKDVTVREIASYMVGHEIEDAQKINCLSDGEEIFRLENLSDGKFFRNISLTLKRGEILGVTGLLGDGRSELFETVFGIHGGNYSGKITLSGKEIHPSSPHEALTLGLAYLPRNRKENAVIGDMSILDNGTVVTLGEYRRFGMLDKEKQAEVFEEQKNNLRIKMADKEKLITTISGGNQQKVILAKWLISDPAVLILDNPTQGVDVGAKEEIYSIIASLAGKGIGIIVLSSEAQEIIRLCDRSIVMYHGNSVGEVQGDDMNENNMMFLATGAGGKENYNG